MANSSIRVSVSFGDKGAVFAGEDVECTITFRNIAPVPGAYQSTSSHSRVNGSISENGSTLQNGYAERRSTRPPLQLAAADKAARPTTGSRPGSSASMGGKAHRPSLSLSMPSARRSYSVTSTNNITTTTIPVASSVSTVRPSSATSGLPTTADLHKHKRSISIVSIGSDAGPGEIQARTPGRRSAPHSRSGSMTYVPKRSPIPNGQKGTPPTSATLPRKFRHPSGATHIIEESLTSFSVSSPRKSPGASRHATSGSLNRTFKFPATPTTPAIHIPSDSPRLIRGSSSAGEKLTLTAGMTNIDLASPLEDTNSTSEFEYVPSSRVLSAQIFSEDTPRSSNEFYSLNNSATDILLADKDGRPSPRMAKPVHSRRTSLLSGNTTKPPEILMMGYAQIQGTFVLDGSLVQTNSFEEIKRKGVVGGQMGGGVVGIEKGRSQNGFLGGLGWGSFSNGIGNGITSGLNNLLTGNNMSSIAEMKSIASSKSIPILSTPQSILFVDLKLAPGESKSYTYTFTLPRTLPPSHRGKAIKVVYNIVIGTQRPGKGVQQPKLIEVPFRVFPHVDAVGGLHTYDLMNPIIRLRDEAKVKSLDENASSVPSPVQKPKSTPTKASRPESSLNEFLQYADTLLNSSQTNASGHSGLLSPSIPLSRRSSFVIPEQPSAKQAIDFAVMNLQGKPGASQIFGITRNGKQVANLSLARPAYKLGEAIIAVIDFSSAQIPCYHVNATLETHETVSSSLALRSAASIYRVTRKVHAQHSESCLFSKRITFVPTIPMSGTPDFSTSGVSLNWSLRIEFIASAHAQHTRQSSSVGLDGVELPERSDGLLERTHKDDRGQLFTAVQHVYCDSFDCSIPVKVYANDIGSSTAGGGSLVGGWTV